MTSQIDPVCGMTVTPEDAGGRSTYNGTTYLFCSDDCLKKFEADPERYLAGQSESRQAPFETHEPAHTKMGSIPLPRFGSAGGGGLEREPGPERHTKKP